MNNYIGKELTPELIAADFWELSDKQQAAFYNHLATIASEKQLYCQMQMVYGKKELTLPGRRAMTIIGGISIPELSTTYVDVLPERSL